MSRNFIVELRLGSVVWIFIEKKENLIFPGTPGLGKAHLTVVIGIEACSAQYRVLFITAQKLIEDLMLSVKDGTITSKLLAYSRLNLLIIDELVYMPVTEEQANLLFQIVSIRDEKGSALLRPGLSYLLSFPPLN